MNFPTSKTGLQVKSLLLATLCLLVIGCPALAVPKNPFLDQVATQISLPRLIWTANGTHTAKGYTTEKATTTNVEGMHADCENINLNRKLATNFRSDVFGPGVVGFFYKCEKISPDTNMYWFTISSADRTQIDHLCNQHASFPIVFDQQHDTWWIDEPFTCTTRYNPAEIEISRRHGRF